jgi:hypothetical protein
MEGQYASDGLVNVLAGYAIGAMFGVKGGR